jgi:hypothetical protein
MPPTAHEVVVATRVDLAPPPDWADAAVDAEGGAGVDALRERVLAELRTGAGVR